VCIKLLGHLKKSSARGSQSMDESLNLIRKSTAAIRRILKSKKARSDYGCIMLLSNIVLRVVELCESTCQKSVKETIYGESQFSSAFGDGIYAEPEQTFLNVEANSNSPEPEQGDVLQGLVLQTADLVAEVGNLLKRKPYDGFQTIGRHEGLHLELGQRLKASLALLS